MSEFNKFLDKIDAFDVVYKHSKRINYLCGVEFKDLTHIPYWDLKHNIPDLINSQKYQKVIYKVINSKKSVTFGKIVKEDNYNKAKFLFWIFDQYELIKDLETKFLSSDPDPKLIRAGINELNILEDFNLIDALAKNYNYTHEQAKYLPYELVFNIQLKNTITSRIDKKLGEIRKEEAKKKRR